MANDDACPDHEPVAAGAASEADDPSSDASPVAAGAARAEPSQGDRGLGQTDLPKPGADDQRSDEPESLDADSSPAGIINGAAGEEAGTSRERVERAVAKPSAAEPAWSLPLSLRWIAGGAVGLVIMGFVIGLVVASAGRSKSSPNTSSGGHATTTDDRFAHSGEPVATPPIFDSFDRTDSPGSLGPPSSGGPEWRADAGTWGVQGGQAQLSAAVGGPNVAVINAGGPDGVAEVRVAKVTNGAGMVFRYRDSGDYWAVVAVPAYATWAVVKVAGGKAQTVANTGLSPTQDGTRVGMRGQGEAVDVTLDGVVAVTVADPTLKDGPLSGVTVQGADAQVARFDDFAAAPPSPPPTPVPPAQPPAPLATPPQPPAPPPTGG